MECLHPLAIYLKILHSPRPKKKKKKKSLKKTTYQKSKEGVLFFPIYSFIVYCDTSPVTIDPKYEQ